MSGHVARSLPERDRQAEHWQAGQSQVETRQTELWGALQSVMDPELDESVVELNFVTKADIDAANHVHIEFRLPTYWCAANFSFLMA
ncbi:iron-sulfur cluster assembly protein, partial [Bradyrhizobium sp.]